MLEQSCEPQLNDAMSTQWVPLGETDVENVVRKFYGLTGAVKRLSSERDETFRFVLDNGRAYTVKIANPAEDPAELAFQGNALLHLAQAAKDVPVPRVVRTLEGGLSSAISTGDGTQRIVRLLTFLDGEQLFRTRTSCGQQRNLGKALADLGRGLSNFEGRPAGKLLWDISHTLDLAPLIRFVGQERQHLVSDVLDEFERSIPSAANGLRTQIIHNDFNPHNILVKPNAPASVVGIIDFGDMVHAPLINDLAVALSYHLASDDWPELTGALIRGYHSVQPLSELEVELLPILVKARLAMTIIITEWRAQTRPENREYILRNHPSALEGLQRISRLSDAELHRTFSYNCEA